ncbi:MAG TPA: M1 family metallopeptidase [Chitinophagaceae bacterium]|nr:M1 family metallopeptidase [Chitinophagaceae bacterium]
MRLVFLFLYLMAVLPAKAYWQQHTATTISVSLDDRNHMLRGYEKIVYTNNAPDTLEFIYIHLWPNAYKNDRTAFCEQMVQSGKKDFYFATEADRGYIDSLRFYADDERATFFDDGRNADVIRLQLPKPLLPGKSVTIETPFRVKIPKVFSRLGHSGQAYFISQWFPKPAVYDHKGWHPMPYLDQGEFYSEFGSYDVSITLPENYVLVATGNCSTEAENVHMDSLSHLPFPSDTLYRQSFPASSNTLKTVRYIENDVHDFAWFADKRWIVRQDTVSGLGNDGVTKITTAFLPAHQKQWDTATALLKKTINGYGTAVGKYPYATLKAVEGDMSAGGGMEYPTVTVIDRAVASVLPTVLIHEAGHNWFYGMLGSNERLYPWMDEGINSFYEHWLVSDSSRDVMAQLEAVLYYQLAAMNEDQAAAAPAESFRPGNYGADVYVKSAHLMEWLEAYMGKDAFRRAMQDYFTQWKFRHPYPEDFRAVIQAHTHKNLDWFFDGALATDRRIDFKLSGARRRGDSLWIRVRNKSGFAAPAAVSVLKDDSTVVQAWSAPFTGTARIGVPATDDWDKIRLSAVAPDFKLANNEYRRYGLLHRGGFRLNPLVGLNRSRYNKMYLLPAMGYNTYDGFGLGLLLHNMSWPQYRFQYAFAPLYSFGSRQLNGAGAAAYSWYPARMFKEIRLQANIKSFSQGVAKMNIPDPLFARYLKVAPSLEFVFREKQSHSTVTRSLLLKQYTIQEQYFQYTLDPVDSNYIPSLAPAQQHTYFLLRYEHRNKRAFHPFSYTAEAQFGESFIKLGLEANARVDYDVKGKSFYLRAYAGKFFSTKTTDNSRYWLNTTYSGVNDYLYDGIYFARNKNEGFGSRQISIQEGGFKIPTNLYANVLGRSDNWLLALNVKTDLPLGKLPLRVYADAATFADAAQSNPSGSKVSFNAGFELHLFGEALSIYAPLLMSSDYKDYISGIYTKDRFLKSIAFSLNIQNFNWLRTHEQIFRLINR